MALFEALLKPLFSKVFVSIYFDDERAFVQVLRFKNNAIIENLQRTFATPARALTNEAVKFVKKYQNKFPFCYVATLSNTPNQGILTDFMRENFKPKSDFTKKNTLVNFIDFAAYIANQDLEAINQNFAKIGGVDYIFSPFCVLHEAILKRVEEALKFYMMAEKTGVTVIIANIDSVYFGEYFAISDLQKIEKNEIQEDEEEPSPDPETPTISTENDDFLSDDDSDFDDEMVDLDLDMLQKVARENRSEIPREMQMQAFLTTQIIEIIQSCMRRFYNAGGNFIEEVVIFDATDLTQENFAKIEDSMLIDIVRHDINIRHKLSLLEAQEFKANE